MFGFKSKQQQWEEYVAALAQAWIKEMYKYCLSILGEEERLSTEFGMLYSSAQIWKHVDKFNDRVSFQVKQNGSVKVIVDNRDGEIGEAYPHNFFTWDNKMQPEVVLGPYEGHQYTIVEYPELPDLMKRELKALMPYRRRNPVGQKLDAVAYELIKPMLESHTLSKLV